MRIRETSRILGMLWLSGCNAILDNHEIAAPSRKGDAANEAGAEVTDETRVTDDAGDAGDAVCDTGPRERSVSCGACDKGKRRQTRQCHDGAWSDWSFVEPCDESQLACKPDEVQTLTPVPCGPCLRGMGTPKRHCSPVTCTWDEPAPAVADADCQVPSGYCMPGRTQQITAGNCGACNKGSLVSSQACDATTCTWSPAGSATCMYLGNTCDPSGPTKVRCKPPPPGSNQASQEWCFDADYGPDSDPAAIAIRCTYGSSNGDPCSAAQCPQCYGN